MRDRTRPGGIRVSPTRSLDRLLDRAPFPGAAGGTEGPGGQPHHRQPETDRQSAGRYSATAWRTMKSPMPGTVNATSPWPGA